MLPNDVAKRILEIAVGVNGHLFVHQIGPHFNQPPWQQGDYQAGFDYAQRMGWILVVGIGHFELTDAGRKMAT